MTGVRNRGKARASAAQAQNRYDAAGNGRRIASWRPPTAGPRRAVEPGFARLRDRVQDAVRNDWAARSSTQKWVTNLVGVGIQPRFKDSRYREVWDDFAKTADADGLLDIYGLQAMGARGIFDPGEVFLRRRPRAKSSKLKIPLQIQVIEGAYCPMFDADAWPGMPEDNRIRQGIELTPYGERAAYWFYREHPHDGSTSPKQGDLVRVAASQVVHLFEVERPGQLRGVSGLATVLTRLRASGDVEEAVLDRQRLANLFALFITRQLPEDGDGIEFDPLTGLPTFYANDGSPLVGLEPGIAQELRPGEDVKFASPPSVGVQHGEYMRGLHAGTAAGQSLPYELMTGDIKDVSDRTLRLVIQEFRRYCQQRQWLTLIPRMCQRMVDWCMEAAVLAGRLPVSQLEKAKVCEWQPQGWEYIHPVQDAEGKKLELEMGVTSKSDIINERGDDPAKVFAQREADAKAEEAHGLNPPEPAPAGQGGKASAPAAAVDLTGVIAALQATVTAVAAQPRQEPALAHVVEGLASNVQAVTSALGTLAGAFASLTAVVEGLAKRPTEDAGDVAVRVVAALAPAITSREVDTAGIAAAVAAAVAKPEPTVVHVQPTPVQIDNHIPQPPAPVVNVQPTPVQIENNVSVDLPERETVSDITRDPSGNITGVKQTTRTVQ